MTTTRAHIPPGLRAVTPYVSVTQAPELLEFLAAGLGGEQEQLVRRSDGTVAHAKVRIDDSVIEVSEAQEHAQARPCALHLYVEDVDAVYERALESGATSLYEPTDQPYGDREAGVEDPAGNHWYLATHQPHGATEAYGRVDHGASGHPSEGA